MTDHETPSGRHWATEPPDRPTGRDGRYRAIVVGLTAVLVVAGGAIGAALVGGDDEPGVVFFTPPRPEGSPGHFVLFEPADSEGPIAFLTLADRPVGSTGAEDATGPDEASFFPDDVGLYGGTLQETCDQDLLIGFLQAHPEKARAWAAVQGIEVDEIPEFVRSLTPAILLRDTRVTNHGYVDGAAVPRQSLLPAGTAVMVDASGTPQVRCLCGNPLDDPIVGGPAPLVCDC